MDGTIFGVGFQFTFVFMVKVKFIFVRSAFLYYEIGGAYGVADFPLIGVIGLMCRKKTNKSPCCVHNFGRD